MQYPEWARRAFGDDSTTFPEVSRGQADSEATSPSSADSTGFLGDFARSTKSALGLGDQPSQPSHASMAASLRNLGLDETSPEFKLLNGYFASMAQPQKLNPFGVALGNALAQGIADHTGNTHVPYEPSSALTPQQQAYNQILAKAFDVQLGRIGDERKTTKERADTDALLGRFGYAPVHGGQGSSASSPSTSAGSGVPPARNQTSEDIQAPMGVGISPTAGPQQATTVTPQQAVQLAQSGTAADRRALKDMLDPELQAALQSAILTKDLKAINDLFVKQRELNIKKMEHDPRFAGQRAFATEQSKAASEALEKVRTGASQAVLMGQRLDEVERAMSDLKTGPLTSVQGSGIKLAQQLGVPDEVIKKYIGDPKIASSVDVMKALNTELSLGLIQLTKGAVSDKEMKAFGEAMPSIANSPEGNRLIIAYHRKMLGLQSDLAELADTIVERTGGFDQTTFRRAAAHLYAQSGISEMTQQARELAARQQGQGGQGQQGQRQLPSVEQMSTIKKRWSAADGTERARIEESLRGRGIDPMTILGGASGR